MIRRAIRYNVPATTNNGPYAPFDQSSQYPIAGAMSKPLTAPLMPPKPTTEATALCGNASDGRLNMFADQAWWAAAAILIRVTASHKFPPVWPTKLAEVTATAQISMVVFRARLTVQPRLIRAEDIHPPPIEPT